MFTELLRRRPPTSREIAASCGVTRTRASTTGTPRLGRFHPVAPRRGSARAPNGCVVHGPGRRLPRRRRPRSWVGGSSDSAAARVARPVAGPSRLRHQDRRPDRVPAPQRAPPWRPALSRISDPGTRCGCNGACGAVSLSLNQRRAYLVLDLAMSAPAGLAGLMIVDGPTRCVLRLAGWNRSLAGMIGTTRSPLGFVRRRTVFEPSGRGDPPLPGRSGPVALPRQGPRILLDGGDPGLSLAEAPARWNTCNRDRSPRGLAGLRAS